MTRSLPSSYATGNQRPTSIVVPQCDANDVLDTLDLLSEAGFECMDWQALLLESWMGVLANGKWAAPSCGNETPRQNGKTRCIQGRSASEMLFYDGTVIYTAQLQKTSTETFEEMAQLMDTKALRKFLSPNGIRTALGREEIRLKSGARMKFLARTRNGGNGQHGSLLIFDEAQELDDDQQASFLPAISASLNPQTIYTGTPPDPTAPGIVFRGIRKKALDGETKRTSWFEYSVEEIGNVSERERWAATNPALGRRILLSTIESECEQMDPDTFARERLGWWAPEKVHEDIPTVISEEDWNACCERCIQLLEFIGIGHSLAMHTNDEKVIREFALKKPVSRILVNTSSAQGGVGATTNLMPALTLGCGAVGGSATSDNVSPLNLINLRRVAYGVKEAWDLVEAPAAKEELDADAIAKMVIAALKEL